MLVEYLKSDQKELTSWLKQNNFIIYSGIGANYICIPKETGVQINA